MFRARGYRSSVRSYATVHQRGTMRPRNIEAGGLSGPAKRNWAYKKMERKRLGPITGPVTSSLFLSFPLSLSERCSIRAGRLARFQPPRRSCHDPHSFPFLIYGERRLENLKISRKVYCALKRHRVTRQRACRFFHHRNILRIEREIEFLLIRMQSDAAVSYSFTIEIWLNLKNSREIRDSVIRFDNARIPV